MSRRPVLFAVDRDEHSLKVLLAGLTRRFGNGFTVAGEVSPATALAALEDMAAADVPVALLLADDGADEFLARAHDLHPGAKRVLLVDRDYTSTSPAVQAMTLGRADYHIVRPWADGGDDVRRDERLPHIVDARTAARLRGVPDRRPAW
jgi:thioredoxin reductase (NADPH)